MKRFYCSILIFIALLSCAFFTACGSKYKNLKMTFVDVDGGELTNISFMLDDADETKQDSMQLGVQFSGVSAGDIGSVHIYSSQNNVSIPEEEISFSNNTFYFNAYAESSGFGQIIAKHLATGKTTKLDLFVNQKSNGLTTSGDRYIVDISSNQPKTFNFNALAQTQGLVKLLPKGSTDTIRFALSSNVGSVSGVSFDTEIVNGLSVLKSMTISSPSALPETTSIFVYPVAVMEGYENALYDGAETRIEIVLRRVLNNTNFALKADSLHQEYVDKGDTIILIANDHSAVTVADEGKYQFDYLPIELGVFDESGILPISQDLFNLYNLKVTQTKLDGSISHESITCEPDGDNSHRILIYASGNISTEPVRIRLSLQPKNCVGEIYEVSKTVTVKAELKPESIAVTMQGKTIQPNNTELYELYDYYYENLGALFTFTPIVRQLEPYDAMKQLQIFVAPAVLNAKGEDFGKMPIFDDTFTTEIKDFSIFGQNIVRTNNNLLDFYVGNLNHPLKFYYDNDLNTFVSEPFSPDSNIYVKYELNENPHTTEANLSFSFATIYSGDLKYLSGISGSDKFELNFKNSRGIRDLDVHGAQLKKLDGGDGQIYADTFNGKLGNADSKDIYIDRAYYKSLTDDKLGAYLLYIDNVVGQSADSPNAKIDSVTLSIEVKPVKIFGAANPIKIKQYGAEDEGSMGLNCVGENEISNFQYTEGFIYNSIILIFDENTSIGEYEISIRHENGFVKTIKCFVAEQLTESELNDSISYTFDGLNEYAYVNKQNGEYTYPEYAADFIVATNRGSSRRNNFAINLKEQYINSNMQKRFEYQARLADANAQNQGYVDLTTNNPNDPSQANALNITFNKGTLTENAEKQYITINFIVVVENFENLFKTGTEKQIVVSKTFFVFEPIESRDITLSGVPNHDIYPVQELGFYYKNLSEVNLTLQFKQGLEGLEKYVQADKNNAWLKTSSSINEEYASGWYSSSDSLFALLGQTDYSIKLQVSGTQISATTVRVTAHIKQFNRTIQTSCELHISIPTITEWLEVLNKLEVNEVEQSSYLDLKQGDTVGLNILSRTEQGAPTFADDNIILVAVDNAGNRSDAISINGNSITVNKMATNIRLLAFAKDALKDDIRNARFVNPSQNLLEGHRDAFYAIDLLLSDGTYNNPYIINDADDFWDIKTEGLVYYRLMNNINLNSKNHNPLSNFQGQLSSYFDDSAETQTAFVYTLFGITLKDDFSNLFENVQGKISNINFEVEYAFSGNPNGKTLGLIGNNFGELENVTVNVIGSSLINADCTFGTLVGVNESEGKISYTSNQIVGASGILNLSGGGNLVFGGLVGQNNGSIEGYTAEVEGAKINLSLARLSPIANSNIVFSVSLGDSGAMTSLNINAENLSAQSTIGGVVGLNKKSIKNVYATGTIKAKGTVGGIIGKNETDKLAITITSQDGITEVSPLHDGYTIVNLTSSFTLAGGDCVGGIVGHDDGGSYYNCHTQIWQGEKVAIAGANYVGGIAGYSRFGIFSFCSVMSYRWDYSKLESTFDAAKTADILGADFVGGIVGCAESELKDELKNESSQFNRTGSDSVLAVVYSSVNALLGTTDGENVFGILNSKSLPGETTAHPIIYSAYFMGKIAKIIDDQIQDFDNKNADGLAISDSDAIYSYVYSINVINNIKQIKTHSNFLNTDEFAITGTNLTKRKYWAISTIGDDENLEVGSLNGGYIYITLNEDGVNPIFEQSPTNLKATVAKHEEGYEISYLLHLNYYDFVLDSTSADYQTIKTALNNKFNRHKILSGGPGDDGLIDLQVEPEILSSVRLVAQSSNQSAISISGNYIVVNGLGKCDLIFYSVLNPQIKCSLSVVVTAPIGDLVLSRSAADKTATIANSTQKIATNKSVQYFAISSASIKYEIAGVGQNTFGYKTSTDVYFKVEVTANLQKGTIGDYLSISGIAPDENSATSMTLIVRPETQFTIKVKQHLKDAKFDFVVIPFTKIDYLDEQGQNQSVNIDDNKNAIEFSVVTYQGPTAINISYEHVALYPNDKTDVYVYISTDVKIDDADLMNYSIVDYISLTDSNGVEIITEEKYENYLSFVVSRFDQGNNLQIVKYTVMFNGEDLQISEEKTLAIRFVLKNGDAENKEIDSQTITFRLYPQRIDGIEIKNYIYDYENGTATIETSDMLRPTGEGLIILNMSPINGYYSYLEITDITGEEEIVFTQIDGINGKRQDSMEVVTADGKGIRLVKLNGSSPIYVATRIDSRYSSRLHTIKVVAYDEFGNILTTATRTIDIKMLPKIEMQYVDPNGVTNDGDNDTTIYLAKGVPAKIQVKTTNSNGNVDFDGTIDSAAGDMNFKTYFEIVQENDGYVLNLLNNDSRLLNATLTLTATTTLTLNDGKTESAEDSLKFKIVEYVIHNVSVNNSEVDFSNRTARVIYGDLGVPTLLNFYLNSNDISYLDNDSYWQTQYMLDPNFDPENAGASIADSIQQILFDIQSKENISLKKYLKLGKMNNGNFVALGDTQKDKDIASLGYNTLNKKAQLIVNSTENNTLALKLEFYLKLNSSGYWEITDNPGESDSDVIEYRYIYILNFLNRTSPLEPEVVKNEQDFLNMVSLPDRHYTLGNDIVLENYTPIDINVASFDGNGRKIIIKSFASFNNAEIYVGLFRQIYSGMIVSNLEVVYLMDIDEGLGWIVKDNLAASTYKDLCTNSSTDYSYALFGGLTPENNGIITNCQVSGAVALRASTIESNSLGQTINFNMGGLVGINNGYITHSDSNIAMVANANIGGLVYQNSGKIASCSFNAENSFDLTERTLKYSQNSNGISEVKLNNSGLIYAYDVQTAMGNTVIVFVGGLAVYNETDAEISMCAVQVGTTGQGSNVIVQNGAIGGFVYSNSGKVYNAYTNYAIFGRSGSFAGFVITNNGQIDSCYTYVNGGELSSRTYTNFANKTTQGITNSYEIVDLSRVTLDSYLRDFKVAGVDYILVQNMLNIDSYSNLMFGDNLNGVWTMSNGLPKLSAVETKVKFELKQPSNEKEFYGLRTIVREDTSVQVGDEIQTIHKYKILDNGYGAQSNPIILYDLESWNDYLLDGTTRYFRLVTDIDFASVYNNPQTSTRTFSGNLQGNNMSINNVMISSTENLQSIGLFKSLVAGTDITIQSVVANLKINTTRFNASRTQAVGILAGIIEGYKIYNITLSSKDKVVVGGNAVGGLAGIVRGNFDLDGITSSANVNSESKSGANFNIYMSVNNGNRDSNIQDVHYAGSVAGILDGYFNSNFNINASRNINGYYVNAKNIFVNSNVTVIGDIAGGLFGFVGERVKLTNANIDVSNSSIIGNCYAGGLIGENRGVLLNSSALVTGDVDIFGSSNPVSAGLAGLNLGGLVMNSSATLNIVNMSNNSTVGGLVGRSVNGFIKDSSFSGNLLGYYTGGIVGSCIDSFVFMSATGEGTIAADCLNNRVVPNETMYYLADEKLGYIENVSLSELTVKYWIDNLSSFYTYKMDRDDLISAIESRRLLGLVVGSAQYNNALENSPYTMSNLINNYGIKILDDINRSKYLTFNGTESTTLIGMVQNANLDGGAVYDTPFATVLFGIEVPNTCIMYVVGATLGSFDGWARNGYSSQMVILTNQAVSTLELKLYKQVNGERTPVNFNFLVDAQNYISYRIVLEDDGNLELEFNYSFLTSLGNIEAVDVNNETREYENNTIVYNFSTNFNVVFRFEDGGLTIFNFVL